MLIAALLILLWIILLLRHPARALPVSAASLLALAVVAGSTLWLERQEVGRLERLDISFRLASNCPAERPLLVQVRNNSGRSIEALRWQLSASLPGQLDELIASPYAARQAAPQELPANAEWQQCIDLPPLKQGYRSDSLEFTAIRRRGSFH